MKLFNEAQKPQPAALYTLQCLTAQSCQIVAREQSFSAFFALQRTRKMFFLHKQWFSPSYNYGLEMKNKK